MPSSAPVSRKDAIRFLDLRRQYESIKWEIDSAITSVLSDAQFVGGPRIPEFERAFADYQGAAHCVAVANGTDALEIAVEALGLPAGSEVIVPATSFIATGEAVSRGGYVVRFADVDAGTLNVSVATLEAVRTAATSAVIPVHLYGRPAPMVEIMEWARKHGLKVIEDAAQAHGAEVGGKRVGSFGELTTFSFYPGKNLGAYGDGGAIVTQDEALATRCRMIANHGRVAKYDHVFEGRNSRLDTLQAAILSVKLKHLDGWIERRRAVAARYRAGLVGVGDLVLQGDDPTIRHVYHLFVVRTAQRDALKAFLAKRGIETGIHYPIALTKLKAYAHLGLAGAPLTANRVDGQVLSIPIGEHLDDGDVSTVVVAVRAFYGV